MTPRVSVVVPCRNEGAALARCLDALDAQDLPSTKFEVLVVDGRSTDGCGAYAIARGHALLQDPGRGPAAARNVGIDAARGEIVAFTDADCVPRFDWLSRLVAAFDADPGVGGVAGGLRMPRDTLLGRLEDNDARVHYRGFITSNIAYRRDVLLQVGGFDEELRCAEDYDLAWRVLDAGFRIEHDLAAVVKHEPPEVAGSLATYLRKQFWYARNDLPAHALAVRRARAAGVPLLGSQQAIAGVRSAARRATWTALAGAGILARSPLILVGALGGAAITSARDVTRTVREVGADTTEIARLAAAETAKRLVRGAGTMAGALDLARPRMRRALRRAGSAAKVPAGTSSRGSALSDAPASGLARARARPWTAPRPG